MPYRLYGVLADGEFDEQKVQLPARSEGALRRKRLLQQANLDSAAALEEATWLARAIGRIFPVVSGNWLEHFEFTFDKSSASYAVIPPPQKVLERLVVLQHIYNIEYASLGYDENVLAFIRLPLGELALVAQWWHEESWAAEEIDQAYVDECRRREFSEEAKREQEEREAQVKQEEAQKQQQREAAKRQQAQQEAEERAKALARRRREKLEFFELAVVAALNTGCTAFWFSIAASAGLSLPGALFGFCLMALAGLGVWCLTAKVTYRILAASLGSVLTFIALWAWIVEIYPK